MDAELEEARTEAWVDDVFWWLRPTSVPLADLYGIARSSAPAAPATPPHESAPEARSPSAAAHRAAPPLTAR
jgi:hypothetical protein